VHSLRAVSRKEGAHPYTLDLLQRLNFDVGGFRPKSWNEFSGVGATPRYFVFTVCDNAAAEACPFWPSQPMTAHWRAQSAAVTGNEAEIRASRVRDDNDFSSDTLMSVIAE
jgi:protein-tyrosine-phosphatase